MRFMKLTAKKDGCEFYMNAEYIVSFWKAGEGTAYLRQGDEAVHLVRESIKQFEEKICHHYFPR